MINQYTYINDKLLKIMSSIRMLHKNGIFLFFGILSIDQLTKFLAYKLIPNYFSGSIEVCKFLNIVLVRNSGISFGFFSNKSDNFKIFLFSIVLSFIFITSIKLFKSKNNLEKYSLTMIISGAIGNLLDRFFYNLTVIDFLDFHADNILCIKKLITLNNYHFPAFNIADASIFLGVMIYAFFCNKK